MENLQVVAPEFPARVNLGRRRTGSPRPANDNGAFARAIPRAIAGETIVVDALAAADSVLRAKAKASAAAVPAPRRRRIADAVAGWFAARMRECFGRPLAKGGDKAG